MVSSENMIFGENMVFGENMFLVIFFGGKSLVWSEWSGLVWSGLVWSGLDYIVLMQFHHQGDLVFAF